MPKVYVDYHMHEALLAGLSSKSFSGSRDLFPPV